MIRNIILNEFGELLVLESSLYQNLTEETQFNLTGLKPVGNHGFCEGNVYINPVSKTHYIIRCNRCGRIIPPFSKEIKTYGQLRSLCADQIAYLEGVDSIIPQEISLA